MKPYAEKFYKSKRWQKVRQSYFVSQHGLCEKCQSPGKIVHHIIHITQENINDSMVTMNHENLELLCQDCHNRHHHGTESTREDVLFDDEGNLVKR